MSELRLRADLVAWQKRIRRPVRRLWAIMLGSCGFGGVAEAHQAAGAAPVGDNVGKLRIRRHRAQPHGSNGRNVENG